MVRPQIVVESPLIRSSTPARSIALTHSLGELSTLSVHCRGLAACFSDLLQGGGSHLPITSKGATKAQWNTAADYLNLAGAIDSVVLDPKCLRPEETFGPKNDVPMQLLNPPGAMVKKLAAFAFIWNALESTVAFLKTRPSIAIIDAGCRFLRDVYGQDTPLPGYDDTLRSLQTKLRELRANDSVNQVVNEHRGVSATGLGLCLVGNLRPQFLAITREFSAATRPGFGQIGTEIVELSSRLTLLSIQHVLVAVMKVESRTVQDEDEGMYTLEVDKLLRSLHLRAQRVDVSSKLIELVESV